MPSAACPGKITAAGGVHLARTHAFGLILASCIHGDGGAAGNRLQPRRQRMLPAMLKRLADLPDQVDPQAVVA